ncbi:MAG: hypothetical protein QG608_1116 [Actinomycetota bacterium]|nr:hypothetical protein [Actinomycetota bacterium]
MTTPSPTFAELLACAVTDAIHLETRDAYSAKDDAYQQWLREGDLPDDQVRARWGSWLGLAGDAVRRGVRIRRARVVSGPLSAYVRYEHAITSALNLAAGEQVRWLPRDQAPGDLFLPVNDFWVFDAHTALMLHHDGDGEETRRVLCRDQHVIARLVDAFEAVWEVGVDHVDYRPR